MKTNGFNFNHTLKYNTMNSIQNLIQKGQTKEAIQLLIDNNDGEISNQGIQLMARYTRLKNESLRGTIYPQDYTVGMNKIVSAVLSVSGGSYAFAPTTNNQYQAANVSDFNETALLEIIAKNRRRNAEIAQEAQQILTDYREYKDTKVITPSFDPVGRRLKVLQSNANALIERLKEEKEISVEQITERIMSLIQADIPTYSDLKEAYKLASGRGFKNEWIERQLSEMPNDNEVIITIAEHIELFVSKIGR